MCDIITCVIVLENLRFRPYTNDKSAFSKTSTLGNFFESLRFWCPKTPFTCALKAKTEKNSQKCPDACGRGQSPFMLIGKFSLNKCFFFSLANFPLNYFKQNENSKNYIFSQQFPLLALKGTSRSHFGGMIHKASHKEVKKSVLITNHMTTKSSVKTIQRFIILPNIVLKNTIF